MGSMNALSILKVVSPGEPGQPGREIPPFLKGVEVHAVIVRRDVVGEKALALLQLNNQWFRMRDGESFTNLNKTRGCFLVIQKPLDAWLPRSGV